MQGPFVPFLLFIHVPASHAAGKATQRAIEANRTLERHELEQLLC
ncbi:hypothetical protein [Pseudomonas sp. KCJK8993]